MRDAYDRFVDEEMRRAKMLERLPKCGLCEDHIQQEDAVRIDGKYYCDNCLKSSREEIGED